MARLPQQVDGIPIHCAYTELRPLESITGNPRNPNTHPEEQIELLAHIIAAQGFRAPITVSSRSGFVVRGHGRLAAARKLGVSAAPVDVQAYADEASEWADLIADNRIAELAVIDRDVLKDLLEELDTGEIDMSLTGFDEDALEKLMTSFRNPEGETDNVEEDEVPDLPAQAVTKPGDLIIMGEHRLVCGDSTLPSTWEALMAGEQAEACFTDPPYNVNYSTDAGSIANDNLEDDAFETFLLALFMQTAQNLKPGAAVYVCHSDTGGDSFRKTFRAAGIQLKQVLVWVKQRFVLSRQDYNWQHEPILYGWTPGAAHRWHGPFNNSTVLDDETDFADMKRSDLVALLEEIRAGSTVLREDRPTVNAEHPTMKPVRLVARCVANNTTKGDLVVDPCGGSGSTLIACDQLGRRCYTIELDPLYCDVIVERWQNQTGQEATRP